MEVPLAVAASAAAAGLAYLNAKTGLIEDYRILSSVVSRSRNVALRQKTDRLNLFYILEQQAYNKKFENSIALIFDDRKWTYKHLYNTALKYGTWLKTTYGIKPKDIIAVNFENSEKFIFIWFGLWSIGARAALLNCHLRGKALVHCIRVSTTSLVLMDPNIIQNLTDEVREELPNVKFVTLTSELESDAMTVVAVREPDSVRSDSKKQNMGMLIFTSGTTGLPKPTIVSWNKCYSGADIFRKWIGIRSSDVVYTCMPLYHSSGSILGCLLAFSAGATLSLGKKFSRINFWNEVRSSHATVIQYVGETCRYLLAAPPNIGPNGENLDKQNKVRAAYGNGLRPDVWDRFKERFDIPIIAEFYGATEGTGAAFNFCRNDFTKGAMGRNGMLKGLILQRKQAIVEVDWTIERPWRDPGTGFCKKVVTGQPGELLYALDGTNIEENFQGYFNDKKATEEKILRDVLKSGDAYFRTGDVVIWDSEGRMYFSDRIGDTYRWRGENVSTNEISDLICCHSSVLEANVYGVQLPHHDGRAGCVALILAEESSPSLMASLAEHVLTHLPRFAVPLFLRVMEDMERTGTNKQQKHVLRIQGVDPAKATNGELYWLKDGSYLKFTVDNWEELNKGSVKL